MQTILGPFHPYLEDALVQELVSYKQKEPLCPVLILVPSDSLRRRLKILLARERRLSLLNVHIRTFYQLSLRLCEDHAGAAGLSLQDNGLLEEMLRRIIRKRLPGAEPFLGLEEEAGGCAALWQTLRDLKDGAVDPSVAREAVKGGLFGEEASEQADRLFALFATFLTCCEEWKINDYSGLDLMALEKVSSSHYLKQFAHIFYYGFYDLTQVQLDLFRAVARRYPTTLFFPVLRQRPPHPAWTFAERFYERYLHGLADATTQSRNLPTSASREPAPAQLSLLPLFTEESEKRSRPALERLPVTIFSCFSGRDEIDTAAKEILRLVSEEGFTFDEIGLVGRSLDSYLSSIKEIFYEHSIPFNSPAEEPLVQYPLVKAILLLIHLPLRDYLRSHVIDLIGSPFFRNSSGKNFSRPDFWDLLTRRLGITKGREEWRRLERYMDNNVGLPESTNDEENPRKILIPASEVRALWNLFTELHGDLSALPKEGTWSEYAALWQSLFKKWLGIEPAPRSDSSPGLVEQTVVEILQRLPALDVIREKIPLSDFLQTFGRWLERARVALPETNAKGVAVLDAMAARGISFRALFILGVNEGLFPRTIREDAFLRDRERESLETVLGYKVATKLGGFDEERLLFTLLVGAAKEKLNCLYQRNDESGRSLAPSWYLDELFRVLGLENLKQITVPRGRIEKGALQPFDRRELLPPYELALQLILTSQDPTPLVHLCLPSPSLYSRGRQVIERLESASDRLTEHDGIVDPASGYWERLCREGMSPTSLEGYARCPFQFFARNLLGLKRLDRPEETTGPAPADVGKIVHSILKVFYQELTDRKVLISRDFTTDAAAILRAAAQRVFVDFERSSPVGYPLAWEICQEEITMLLEQVVARDLKELSDSGYQPVAFECEATDQLPEDWPNSLSGLTICGRMDRIDYRSQDNSYRIIDYKLKYARSRSPADKNLLRSALRGQRLQPPFYLLLGKKQAQRQNAAVGTAFYFLAPQWSDGPLVIETFPGDAWEGRSGTSLKESVAFLVDGIRRGFFFIQPGDDYCRYCEVSEICRKTHLATAWRVERDPRTGAHLALREKEAE